MVLKSLNSINFLVPILPAETTPLYPEVINLPLHQNLAMKSPGELPSDNVLIPFRFTLNDSKIQWSPDRKD